MPKPFLTHLHPTQFIATAFPVISPLARRRLFWEISALGTLLNTFRKKPMPSINLESDGTKSEFGQKLKRKGVFLPVGCIRQAHTPTATVA